MKLQTSILPRRTGVVLVNGDDGLVYEFAPGEDGELSCDVGDDATAVRLLATGQFWPASPDDFDKAVSLTSTPEDEGDEGDEDGDGDDAPPRPPIEAKTPAKAGSKKAK